MRFALGQTGAYLCHEIGVKDLLNGLSVEVAQHVGIAGTAGFDITTGIDMQATPGCGTIKIAHLVFTDGLDLFGISEEISEPKEQ